MSLITSVTLGAEKDGALRKPTSTEISLPLECEGESFPFWGPSVPLIWWPTNLKRQWLFPRQDPSVTTMNRAPCQLMMNLQPPKGKKKNLCILKLASLWGYLLLQHNLTILTDT